MMNDKRGFTLGGFFIGLLILSVIAITFAALNRNIVQTYGNGDPAQFDKYNYTSQLVTNATTATNEEFQEDFTITGFFTKRSFATVMTVLRGGVTVSTQVVTDISSEIGIPDWQFITITTIIVLALILIIVSAIFRWPLINQ